MSALFRILTMFGPLSGAKFWVAVIMAIVQFVHIYSGIDLGLDEATVAAIVGGVGALLVWLVPNKPKPSLPEYTDAEILAKNNAEMGLDQSHIPTRNR